MIIATFSGLAQTGAVYVAAVDETDGAYTLIRYPGKAVGLEKPQVPLPLPDRAAALAALLRLACEKRAGSERSYTRLYPGVAGYDPCADNLTPALGKALVGDALPDHPQLWRAGQDVARVPPFLRGELGGTPPDAPATMGDQRLPFDESDWREAPMVAAPVAQAVPVMLCKVAPDPEALLTDPHYLLMRKEDGDRRLIAWDGVQVIGYNRSGSPSGRLPDAIVAVIRQLPAPVILDGELVVRDARGRERIFAGIDATQTAYIAYDVLEAPNLPNAQQQPQLARLVALKELFAHLEPQASVAVAAWALSAAEKAAMLAEAQASHWEGLVARAVEATYKDGRHADWLKWKLLRGPADVFVIGYGDGKGRRSNGMVGVVKVAVFDDDVVGSNPPAVAAWTPEVVAAMIADGQLLDLGEVGTWDDATLREFARRREAGRIGYTVGIISESLTASCKVNKPSGECLRDDKRPEACVLSNEFARWHAHRAEKRAPTARAA